MGVDELTWPAWDAAEPAQRELWIHEAAARVGGSVDQNAIEVRGVRLALVPGGQVKLGWNGAATTLEAERRADWEANAEFDGTFETFLRYYLGPQRSVVIRPFLIESVAIPISELGIDPYGDDPERALRKVITKAGFRLPGNDEWEVAMRAGAHTLFAWGDSWPDGIPYQRETSFGGHMQRNALGIQPRIDPYETEVIAEKSWLRAGDGGCAICGGRPYPEAWYSFALAFQLPRENWGDLVAETFEMAFVRRTLSLNSSSPQRAKKAKRSAKPGRSRKPTKRVSARSTKRKRRR